MISTSHIQPFEPIPLVYPLAQMEPCPEVIPARPCGCFTTAADNPNELARDDDSKNSLGISCQPPKSGTNIKKVGKKRKSLECMKDAKETQRRINTLTINAASVSESQNRRCVSEYMAFLGKLYGLDSTLE